jgi:hypothetical protein
MQRKKESMKKKLKQKKYCIAVAIVKQLKTSN